MSDGFFSDTHVTEAGLQGSLGPSVGLFGMVPQDFRQQWYVDSQFALDQELHNRWQESLRAAGLTVNVTGSNPHMMRDFAQFVRDGSIPARPTFRLGQDLENMGQPVETGPDPEFEEMRRANEAIRQLNNPRIRTFEQILEEVSAMQHGVEEETASMSERAPWYANLIGMAGSIVGSFTLRDPLNVVTAPVGAGRTVAMRIATDMAVAGGVTAVTEFTDVAPNRALVGLPERNPYYNIVASTLGAGLIRGGIEGIGAGVRNVHGRFVGEDIDFNLRDTQLQQMFNNAPDTPTTRAGIAALDDTIFIERNNPYGEGQAAQARFLAELQEVQRAMNGEPMTAIARALPPMPFEMLEKAADFEIVREQAPLVYARMEQAQARLAQLNNDTKVVRAYHGTASSFEDYSLDEALFEKAVWFSSDPEIASAYAKTSSPGGYRGSQVRFDDLDVSNFAVHETGRQKYNAGFVKEAIDQAKAEGQSGVIFREMDDGIGGVNKSADVIAVLDTKTIKPSFERTRLRRKANIEYQTAYRAVEAEAARLHEAQAKIESAQRRESASILLPTAEGRPFIGPMLQHDYVESLVDRINKFNDTLDEATVARFTRETVGEGEAAIEREAWRTDAGIDIGLKEPVDPEFRFETDGGEMTVADAMRDLQDDTDLDDAMRTCML